MSKINRWRKCRTFSFQISFFSQETKSSQLTTRGGTYENSRYQKNNNEQGNGDNNNYAGGSNRGGSASSSSQVYRPPHLQNRMNNVPK